MKTLFNFGLNIIGDIFYPKYCFGCKRPGSYLCKFCMVQVPNMAKSYCIVCNSGSPGGFTHQRCRSSETPDRLLCAFPYQNSVISDMIITGKYYFIPEVFAVLGAMAADRLFLNTKSDAKGNKNFVACAIPLHISRYRWRGFNQAEIAGKIFAQGLRIPYANLLTRAKKTKTQKELTAEERISNVANAFESLSIHPDWQGTVLLVDDVTTTGQTLLEATRALRRAGAKEVWCCSIAKD